MDIVIINYGAGNIKSIEFALARLGYQAVLSKDPETIRKADKVIFPGVGEASSAMTKLKDSGLDILIPSLIQPVLGICLGMQLMCESSEEGNTVGLGIFNTAVKRFNQEVKVPQIQWNAIQDPSSELFNGILEGDFIYMVHSYYAPLIEDTIASCNYGINYSAALAKDNFYGTQFHPEKSSSVGRQLLQNFINL
ncbi:MAG: imidazole glycerol phosphate synthase subunit HisH [Bacteroidetes bacterium]|nr:imidazole glycerol phosphate synthase subunit HisH [Bacteroidota bacterium]